MLIWLRQEIGKIIEKRNISRVVGDGVVSVPRYKILPLIKSYRLALKRLYLIQILIITIIS